MVQASKSLAGRIREFFAPARLAGASSSDCAEENEKKSAKLLVSFQGRQGGWDGMGRGLYRSESVYRDSVEKCSALVEEFDGFRVLDLFESAEVILEESLTELQIIYLYAVNQIALSDLWKSKGLRADAVVGLSLGEATSTYFCGIHTLREVLAIVHVIANWDARVTGRGVLFVLETSLEETYKFYQDLSVDLECFAEIGPNCTVVFCPPDSVAVLKEAVANAGIPYGIPSDGFGYHMFRFAPFQDLVAQELAELNCQDSEYQFYSSMLGGPVPSGVLYDSLYWYWMTASSTYFQKAADAAIRDGCDVVLNIGPHATLSKFIVEIAQKHGKEPIIIDSMRNDQSEIDTFYNALKTLTGLGLIENAPAVNNEIPASLQVSADNFDQMSPEFVKDPYFQLSQLRQIGALHYIEKDNSWLVLDHEDVVAALKNSAVFSNEPWRDIDIILAGAEPEEHARVLKIIRPLFDKAAMEKIAISIELQTNKLLDDFAGKKHFDVANDFSMCLAELVMADFLGLSREIQFDMEKNLGNKIYRSGEKFMLLENYFKTYLTESKLAEDNFANKLLLGDGKDCLSLDQAAKLMKLFWIAGTSSTSMLINNTVKILLSHAAVRHAVQQNLSLVSPLIEEVLRFDPPVHTEWRRTISPTVISGQIIPANALVKFSLAAANRDPKRFDRPELFILNRTPNNHVSFGAGIHHCIGAALARLEATIATRQMLVRFPHIRALTDVREIPYEANVFAREMGEFIVATDY